MKISKVAYKMKPRHSVNIIKSATENNMLGLLGWSKNLHRFKQLSNIINCIEYSISCEKTICQDKLIKSGKLRQYTSANVAQALHTIVAVFYAATTSQTYSLVNNFMIACIRRQAYFSLT